MLSHYRGKIREAERESAVNQGAALVVAGVIRRGEDVLVVQQQGPHDVAPYWALPSGRAEAGELIHEALIREVREETGLDVVEIGRLLYMAQAQRAPEDHIERPEHADTVAGIQTVALVFEVVVGGGDPLPADPDGFIRDARFLPVAEAFSALEAVPYRVLREPLLAYLGGNAGPGAVWLYCHHANGSDQLIHRFG